MTPNLWFAVMFTSAVSRKHITFTNYPGYDDAKFNLGESIFIEKVYYCVNKCLALLTA